VALVGVEAGGRSARLGDHASTLLYGKPGVLHGSFSYVLQDEDGQTADVHSISAGLDYPGVGPEHSYWKETGRVAYTSVSDRQALEAFQTLARLEGILACFGKRARCFQGYGAGFAAIQGRDYRCVPFRPRR